MTDRPQTRFDVFISYSHRDMDVVLAIDTALRVNSLRVFLDRRDIALGDALTEAVFEGIASARAQLVVLSGASLRRGGFGMSSTLAGRVRFRATFGSSLS
jgi:hypothetical protein